MNMTQDKNPYQVGISTGFWKIGKDPALLGLAMKIGGIGATGGIQFVQVDLETVAEFAEPQIKEQIIRMKNKLGILAGLHGEIGELMALDSAEKRIWDQTHKRLCQTVKYAAELGFFYVNIHFSNRQLISFTESQHRTQGYFYPVVGPDGKGLQSIVDGNPGIYDEVKRRLPRTLTQSTTFKNDYRNLREQKLKQLPALVAQEVQRELGGYPPEQVTEELKKQRTAHHERIISQNILEEASREAGQDDFQFNS